MAERQRLFGRRPGEAARTVPDVEQHAAVERGGDGRQQAALSGDNAADLTTGALTIEPRTGPRPRITTGPRVGITRAVDLALRFWIATSPSVSRR